MGYKDTFDIPIHVTNYWKRRPDGGPLHPKVSLTTKSIGYSNQVAWLAPDCNVTNDESHPLNTCKKWKNVNLYNKEYSIEFNSVFSEEKETLYQMSTLLKSVWNLEYGKNEMRC